MAAVNTTLLREEFDVAKTRIKTVREAGKVSPEVDAVIGVLLTLLNILITVLPEKTRPRPVPTPATCRHRPAARTTRQRVPARAAGDTTPAAT